MNRAIIEMSVPGSVAYFFPKLEKKKELIQKPSYEGFLLKSYKYSLKYF